jgi:hypothetical protein
MFNRKSILIALGFALLNVSMMGAQNNSEIDSTGLPGDHFSLQGALELFKTAKSPEQFEELLNKEKNYVNNLDLNGDGEVDYVRVEDKYEGDVHALVLQVPVNKKEAQDIAVIEIELTGNETAVLQIVGDADIYGEEVIVEPFEDETDDSKGGPFYDIGLDRLVINVYFWPSVRFVYRPAYVAWVSPFHWLYYPRWWKPWRPHPWSWHYSRRVHYHRHYHVVTTHRVVNAHRVYTPRRTSSKVVSTRYSASVSSYRVTKAATGKSQAVKRTTVQGPNGGKVTATKKTTAAGAKGAGGAKVGTSKTTTTVAAQGPKGGKAVGKKTTTKTKAQGPKGRKVATSKTTEQGVVKGSRGNMAAGKKTTSQKAVKGKNGNKASVKKTTSKKAGKTKNGNKVATKKTTKTTKVKRKK